MKLTFFSKDISQRHQQIIHFALVELQLGNQGEQLGRLSLHELNLLLLGHLALVNSGHIVVVRLVIVGGALLVVLVAADQIHQIGASLIGILLLQLGNLAFFVAL